MLIIILYYKGPASVEQQIRCSGTFNNNYCACTFLILRLAFLCAIFYCPILYVVKFEINKIKINKYSLCIVYACRPSVRLSTMKHPASENNSVSACALALVY